MNDLFDKLIVRIAFAIILCVVIFVYKYIHSLIYHSSRGQLFKKFYPSHNSANSLHLFSRILGIGIIFSSLSINLEKGMLFAIFNLLVFSIVGFVFYLLSIYIFESIIFYKFEYHDEIIKRKNYSYCVVNIAMALSLSMIIKIILQVSNSSIILFLFLWFLSMVILGFSSKVYKFISKYSFNKLMHQKNMGLAFSYSGFLLGCTILLVSSLKQNIMRMDHYSIMVVLKIILSIIILPLFLKGLVYIFKIQEDFNFDYKATSNKSLELSGPEMGHGIYEGVIFLTAGFLTSIITGHIHFGTFYPPF